MDEFGGSWTGPGRRTERADRYGPAAGRPKAPMPGSALWVYRSLRPDGAGRDDLAGELPF